MPCEALSSPSLPRCIGCEGGLASCGAAHIQASGMPRWRRRKRGGGGCDAYWACEISAPAVAAGRQRRCVGCLGSREQGTKPSRGRRVHACRPAESSRQPVPALAASRMRRPPPRRTLPAAKSGVPSDASSAHAENGARGRARRSHGAGAAFLPHPPPPHPRPHRSAWSGPAYRAHCAVCRPHRRQACGPTTRAMRGAGRLRICGRIRPHGRTPAISGRA